MFASINTFTNRFKSDEHGAVILIFGLAMFGFLMAGGMALDATRAVYMKGRVSSAADAAVLAAGKALLDGRLTEDDVKETAKQFFLANLQSSDRSVRFGQVPDPEITVDRETGTIRVEAVATVPMTLSRIAGIESFTIPVTAESVFDQKDIELSVALDLTGSMRGDKIESLKLATSDLIDIMLPPDGTPNRVRLALAPYSSGVDAGSYANAATGVSDASSCTFEREGDDPTGDQAPASENFIKSRQAADIPNSAACPSGNTIVPLTDDRSLLQNTVDGYQNPTGSTAGHLGIQWAWYMVSENWGSVFGGDSQPEAYGNDKIIKSVIVMTDGVFNTADGQNNGANSERGRRSRQFSREMCSNMRDQGIQVFAVGFQLDDEDATQLLADCAGNPNRFFRAENEEGLRSAFADVANQLNRLRLSK